MNTFGSEAIDPAPAPHRRKPSADFIDTLGRFAQSPLQALDRVVERPDPSQAFVIAFLTFFASFLAEALQGDWVLDARGVGKGVFSILLGMALWRCAVSVGHWISLAFKKEGSEEIFLCLTGWSLAVFWGELPLALLSVYWPETARLAGVLEFSLTVIYLYFVWKSLRISYGWSGRGATAVLLVPMSVLSLLFFLVLLAGAFIAIGGSMLSKFF